MAAPIPFVSILATPFGETTFGELTFGEMTFGEMPFSDLTFSEMAFCEMTFSESSGHRLIHLYGLSGSCELNIKIYNKREWASSSLKLGGVIVRRGITLLKSAGAKVRWGNNRNFFDLA